MFLDGILALQSEQGPLSVLFALEEKYFFLFQFLKILFLEGEWSSLGEYDWVISLICLSGRCSSLNGRGKIILSLSLCLSLTFNNGLLKLPNSLVIFKQNWFSWAYFICIICAVIVSNTLMFYLFFVSPAGCIRSSSEDLWGFCRGAGFRFTESSPKCAHPKVPAVLQAQQCQNQVPNPSECCLPELFSSTTFLTSISASNWFSFDPIHHAG